MSSNPTNKRRHKRQKLHKQYAQAREELQLMGELQTTPQGALKANEVVQTGNAVLPELVRQALKENWATPDCAKPAIVANLLEPFFEERRLDANGKPLPPDRRLLVECAKTLRALDQTHYERENPEAAGAAKGGIAISLANTMQATEAMREALPDVDAIMELTRLAFEEPVQASPTDGRESLEAPSEEDLPSPP